MEIKGEYEMDILIQNMFNSYNIVTRNSNVVTNEGLNFILRILARKTNAEMGNICIGTNTTEPSIIDNTESFTPTAMLQPQDIDVENNKLTYIINTDGANINGTYEIGIFSSDENIAITRDVHDRYDVPNSAIITIKYSLTLTNKGKEEMLDDDCGMYLKKDNI